MGTRITRRAARRAFLAALLAVASLLPARPARAGVFDDFSHAVDSFFVGVFVVGALIGTDIAFTVHDAGAVSRPPPADPTWSLAETIVGTPQLLLADTLVAVAVSDRRSEDETPKVVMLLPAVWAGSLGVHGMWGVASPQSSPGLAYGGSWAIGADATFTVGAVTAAFGEGHLPGKGFGVAEIVGTSPSLAVGIVQLAEPGTRWKPAWAVLTGWSGALLVHGVVTTAKGFRDTGGEKKEENKKAAARWPRLTPLLPTGRSSVRGLALAGEF